MRALLIGQDGVQEIEIAASLEAMYEAIGCQCVDGAGYPNPTHAAWVDDVGLLQDLQNVQATRVAWHRDTLAGKILVTGFDPATGDTAPATMSVAELRSMVKIGWFSYQEPGDD